MANNTQTRIKTIITSPRVTEKAALAQDKGVYVFNVADDATKNEVKKQIKEIYKVDPVKINMARNAKKQVFVRGRKGTKQGVKKAYVYLKDGDKITVM